MHRIIFATSLFVLFSVDIVDNATALANNYEKKLREVAKENRSFRLPNAVILKQEISGLGMEHFIEKTGLIDKIANRYLKELGIYMSVDLAYYDYIKYLKENTPHQMLELLIIQDTTIREEMKPLLIDAIIRVSKEVEHDR